MRAGKSARRAMQQRLAAVGEMAAGIAHEIRNPLASMSGSLQILRQELPLSDEQSQLMDIVLRESDRLNETIRSFLAYARPQRNASARLDVRQVVTDTATLLQNSPERLRRTRSAGRADRAGVVHRRRGADPADRLEPRDQRPAGDGGWRHADARGASRRSPSRKAPRSRSPSATRASASRPTSSTASFSRSAADLRAGTGLGLSIVHRIVSDYGGELAMTSARGKGTTVTVKLPAGGEVAEESLKSDVGTCSQV